MNCLQANEVVYAYQNKYQLVQALSGVSADFAQGQLYAIIGASGSGKTTFLSLLAGLDVPTSGSITWNGTSTAELDRDAYRLEHVSVIYQDFNLFSHLTVLENAAYPLYARKMSKKEGDALAKEKLLALGLKEEQLGRFPNMLSGGEQQRVAIARSLAAGSEIILADEPTGNLDPARSLEIMRLLSENSRSIIESLRRLAKEENRCVIVVTHDPVVAEAADVVLRMQDGKFILGSQ